VKPLATFKHISSKNADYGAAEQYLTFAHDEFTMKPTLDENGRLIPREDYRISSLNCGEEDFAVACMRANLRYGKNLKKEDVKSHHYIISFDPRDGPDNGLTVDQAQMLGEKFCREQFPGHQALVCTHPDGHNHSGNIHVHIVINSLRIEEVPLLPYMNRPADTRAGYKHRCASAAMEYFKAEVMELCHRENLYQIDLLNGSKNRITEREYWAKKKGQLALDKENSVLAKQGKPIHSTKFETDKEKLRQTIRKALDRAESFDGFSSLLLQYGVTVKESRGRFSYLTPDRTKSITARKLGDDFDKAAVLVACSRNAERAAKKDRPILSPAKPEQQKKGVQRMVDIEAKRAEGKGIGYENWAKVFNLKQMAATHNFLFNNDYLDREKLDEAVKQSYREVLNKQRAVRDLENQIAAKTELRKVVSDYLKSKPVVMEGRKLKGRKAEQHRESHEADYIIHEAALRRLKELAPGNRLPSIKTLNAEINVLISEKNAAYNEYHRVRDEHKELSTVRHNMERLFPEEQTNRRSHDRER
jgi:uncharacterized protein YbcV (DUF1398 family)